MDTQQQLAFGLSAVARRSRRQPISYLMTQALTNPELISLAAGLVDYGTLPAGPTAKLLAEMLGDAARARAGLQYGTTEGLADLRTLLLAHFAELDGAAPAETGTPEDIVVTTGSQQLLYLLTSVLVDPGDIVITSWPSYFVYTSALEAAGAEVRGVDMDAGGMLPDALEELLTQLAAEGKLGRVKIVYVVGYHQNPTGITLAEDRKPRLVEIVRRFSREHRILLMEDAAYRELTYSGSAPRSCRAFDDDGQFTAVLQTFSKPFAPGLKTGYGLLPRDLIEPVTLQKGNMDFGSANLMQHLLAEAMRTGVYAEHVRLLCAAYAVKRDAMLAALDEELGGFHSADTHWTRPTGGLYVYLTLPGHIATGENSALLRRAIAEGVLYVPGEYCFGPDPTRTAPTSTMRLTFAMVGVPMIREGIARLARAVRAVDD